LVSSHNNIMRKLIPFLLACLPAGAANSTIQYTETYGFFGLRANCTFTIVGPNVPGSLAGGADVTPSTLTYEVRAGVVNLSLVPNDAITPSGTSYRVTKACRPPAPAITVETWVVPTSASPLGIDAVRVAAAPSPAVYGIPSQTGNIGKILMTTGTIPFWALDRFNVRAFGAVGDGSTDDTAAIQAAITALTIGGTVVIPQGIYKITSTIAVTTPGTRIIGLGQNYPGTNQGTILRWAGAANGTVLSTTSCNGCMLENFTIDGATTAGRGILIDSNNDATMQTVRDVWIWDVKGSPGIALTVGNAAHPVTSSTFDHINIQGCATGVLQIGAQSVKNIYTRMGVSNFTSYGFDFTNSDVTLTHSQMGSSLGAIADVIVRDTTTWAVFIDNEHETSTVSYLFPSSIARPYPTLIQSTRILNINTNGLLIDYQQGAPLLLIGDTFMNLSSDYATTVNVNVPGGGSAATFVNQANVFLNNVTLAIAGNVDQAYAVGGNLTVGGTATVTGNLNASSGIFIPNNLGVNGGTNLYFDAASTHHFRSGFVEKASVTAEGLHTVASQVSSYGFSGIPACNGAAEGTRIAITDANTATWGATITGGSGGNHVMAYCNGTDWTVAGK
jgi:hypothetical protein